MKNITDKDIMKKFNNVLDDYGFICADIRRGINGIEREYNDFTCFEDMRLNIITNNKGVFVSLYILEELIFTDKLSIDTIRLYNKEGISFEYLVEVIIDTIDDFLESEV